ncbi:MAG: T9SS type A sorting domain-containing protein, partial [Rhodothermaceae bacterium]|nr:T9SS type A sorting domain-containing protein [Rhodothermaceae bacterium]
YMGPGRDQLPAQETSRSESGDTDRHRAFRERLRPIMGHGDKTVPLLSATLGRNVMVGKADFSGVDQSDWIEEFEYFSCEHGKLVEENCLPLAPGGNQALDRIVNILISGHQVLPDDDMQKNQTIDNLADAISMNREVFYVHGDAPIRVIITDSEGVKTGPTDPENPGAIERGIPDIYYRASILGAVISVPSGKVYAIEAVTLEAESRVFITRQQAGEENLVQIIYPDQYLIAGSSLSFNLEPGGTLQDQPWQLDTDGDGLPDFAINPALVLPASSSVPALPVPQPSNVIAGVPSGGTIVTRTLHIPDNGTQGWSYSLSGGTPWLEIISGSGSIPATIELVFDATGLPIGDFTTTLDLTLQNGDYSTELTVPVTFTVGITVGIEKLEPQEIPDQFRLWAAYPNPFNPSTTITYDLTEPVHVKLTVYDIMGRKITTLVDQQLAAGRHTAVFEAGSLSSGTYIYRIEAGNITQMMKMMLLK